MKWKNKGHEFDAYAKGLVRDFRELGNQFYIFGAGLIGGELKDIIEKTGCFAGFIDNDRRKQKISLDEYLERGRDGLIIIATDDKNIPVIEEQLVCAGLKKERDFYEYRTFMKKIFPFLSVYANHQVYTELAQICLTERCTLRCRKCAHGCYAVGGETQDMDVETAKKSADYFFRYVDIVKEFVLIGGEPFLYKKLGEMVAYIGEKYREKIVIFSITTNGTIIPGEELLHLCRRYHVTIRISDYSAQVKRLEEKYGQLKERLERNQIAYTMSDRDGLWMDYGFESVDRKRRGGGAEGLLQVFGSCRTPCREIRGSRYYYCVMARSVSDNLGMGLGKEDYLDLDEINGDKKILLEYEMGFSGKGYLDMCNHCRGAEAVKYPIPAGEQIKSPRWEGK